MAVPTQQKVISAGYWNFYIGLLVVYIIAAIGIGLVKNSDSQAYVTQITNVQAQMTKMQTQLNETAEMRADMRTQSMNTLMSEMISMKILLINHINDMNL